MVDKNERLNSANSTSITPRLKQHGRRRGMICFSVAFHSGMTG